MPPLQPRSSHLGLILPLCTSSATLGLSLFQYPLFNSFLYPGTSSKSKQTRKISGTPFSQFWATFLPPGAGLIAGITLVSAASGLFSARWLRSHATLETMEVGGWYFYGAVFALGHLAFVPAVAGPINTITAALEEDGASEMDVQARNEDAMKTWFMWHTQDVNRSVDLLTLVAAHDAVFQTPCIRTVTFRATDQLTFWLVDSALAVDSPVSDSRVQYISRSLLNAIQESATDSTATNIAFLIPQAISRSAVSSSSQHFGVAAGPSTPQSLLTGSERRNSLDEVIAVATARAAEDPQEQALSTDMGEQATESAPALYSPFSPCYTPGADPNMFEEIELQDWPVTSQVSAINLVSAVLNSTPPSSPKHVSQLPSVSDATRNSTHSPSGAMTGLWDDLLTVLAALRARRNAKD
ncbi:hypothetical protein Q7P37_005345 [Cladosporium fusiforme]